MSIIECKVFDVANIYFNLFQFILHSRLWNEIKEQAKVSLMKIYSYLAGEKFKILDQDTKLLESGTVSRDFYFNHLTPEILLKRWKCVTGLFIENGFI